MQKLAFLLIVLLTTGALAQDGEQWTEDGESGAALPEMVVELVTKG